MNEVQEIRVTRYVPTHLSHGPHPNKPEFRVELFNDEAECMILALGFDHLEDCREVVENWKKFLGISRATYYQEIVENVPTVKQKLIRTVL